MTLKSGLLSRRLLEFNLLPSRTLHPSRQEEYAPVNLVIAQQATPSINMAWHRHWSHDILHRLDLLERPVQNVSAPELPLALLPFATLELCARCIGLVLCAPRLLCTIEGEDVRSLLSVLGDEQLDFARRTAPSLHSGLSDSRLWSLEQTVRAIDELGYSTLFVGLANAPVELTLRVELKLPDRIRAFPDSPLKTADALALGLTVLKSIDPSWHSLFPATH